MKVKKNGEEWWLEAQSPAEERFLEFLRANLPSVDLAESWSGVEGTEMDTSLTRRILGQEVAKFKPPTLRLKAFRDREATSTKT